MRNIFLAARIVETPMVIELTGVLSMLPNDLAASFLDALSRRMSRVAEFNRDPGSLKAMFPTRPIPSKAMSMPPKLAILCSYNLQYSNMVSLAMVPSGVKRFCLSMST